MRNGVLTPSTKTTLRPPLSVTGEQPSYNYPQFNQILFYASLTFSCFLCFSSCACCIITGETPSSHAYYSQGLSSCSHSPPPEILCQDITFWCSMSVDHTASALCALTASAPGGCTANPGQLRTSRQRRSHHLWFSWPLNRYTGSAARTRSHDTSRDTWPLLMVN